MLDRRRGFTRRSWEKRKPKGPTAKARAKKATAAKRREYKNKDIVRDQDVYCRFPLCRCRERLVMQHVSHQKHKGMGGNPTGDRSVPSLMLMLCAWRHREAPISVDQGTLRWRALTKAGARGPVAWEIKHEELVDRGLVVEPGERTAPLPVVDGWVEIAAGVDLGAPSDPLHAYKTEPWQREILDQLAEMQL